MKALSTEGLLYEYESAACVLGERLMPDHAKRLIEIGEADFDARADDVDALLKGTEVP